MVPEKAAQAETAQAETAQVETAQVKSPTELRNPRTEDIDTLPTLDVLRRINAEDAEVAGAVERALPRLASAVDAAAATLRAGGRVHYFGAGTSGRIGTLDAAELPPTYGVGDDLVVAHQAGGLEALSQAAEDLEDDADSGAADTSQVSEGDVALGLAASGRTPYVIGALRAARAAGASTVMVSANPNAPFGAEVDVHVAVDTGPEAIAGSTRMKAGTAQKMVLGAFSTALMVRLGRTYSNLMVGMVATNAKLRGRTVTILEEASGSDAETCGAVLEQADGDARIALVALLSGAPVARAGEAVAASNGSVRDALTFVAQ